MANDLTGDFDVVAEFTIPAANRILAAMHRGSRLPHSWSLRVDNSTHIHIPLGTTATVTGVRSVVDKFGEALTDPGAVSKVSLPARAVSVINVNTDFPVNLPKPAPVNMGSPSIRPDVSGFIGWIETISPPRRNWNAPLI
jgi:hypothetical protein